MKIKNILPYLLFVALVLAALLLDVVVTSLWGIRPFVSESLHSSLEAFSALSALMMAAFLFIRKDEKYGGTFLVLSIGFLGMGLIEGFHAFAPPGQAFVLLRVTSNLVGGFWFALIWLPFMTEKKYNIYKEWALLIIAIMSIIFWFWVLMRPENIPVMALKGQFTIAAKAINFSAGVLFLAAAIRLLLDYYKSGKIEIYLLSFVLVLFSLASLTFTLSSVWDASWWYWHILRLTGYLIVLGFIFIVYQKKVLDLKTAHREIRLAEKDIIRLYSEQSKIADVLQKALITVPDKIPGIEFGHTYESATEKPGFVGGDFYDIFEIENTKNIGIMIGDVSGKGIEAAKLTAVIKNTIKALTLYETSPSMIFKKTRKLLKKILNKYTFVSVFFGILDKESGDLLFCSGGHPPAIVKKITGKTEKAIDILETKSAVIGLSSGLTYIDSKYALNKSDVLVLYTDGLIEARKDKIFFGQKRLEDFIKDIKFVDAKYVPHALLDEVNKFSGGILHDDIAILSVSITK